VWWQRRLTKQEARKRTQRSETEGCKGARAVATEKRPPGSQILHSEIRRVKLNRAGIVSCKPTNRKKVVNHRRCSKNVVKTKGAMSVACTHGRDRKTRAICDHDGRRMRRRWRVNGGEYTLVVSGVVSGSRVGDPGWLEVAGPWC
jgi:hypothetical protein